MNQDTANYKTIEVELCENGNARRSKPLALSVNWTDVDLNIASNAHYS